MEGGKRVERELLCVIDHLLSFGGKNAFENELKRVLYLCLKCGIRKSEEKMVGKLMRMILAWEVNS